MQTLKLISELEQALKECGFEHPIYKQKEAIMNFKAGKDIYILGDAQTGKTTSSIIAIIQKLKSEFEDAPRALIITESSEIALQYEALFKKLSMHTNLRCSLAIENKQKITQQFEAIYYGTDVIIGTTKRIMDLYFKYSINLNKINVFIIDNAEQQIKQELQGLIDRLTQSLSQKCQLIVCATTLTDRLQKLISKLERQPIAIFYNHSN